MSASNEMLGCIAERSAVMQRQEDRIYTCRDYLLRRKKDRKENRPSSPELCATPSDSKCEYDSTDVDEVCRQKMCEWSYRIVDYYSASREIVAIAFSFLDRFLDKCHCDRTAFKLAAMTCLHLASKITSSKQFSVSTLAKLSRGEFDEKHIADMENIILNTLGWHLHPPSVLSFLHHLCAAIPTTDERLRRRIFHHAVFFAELSVLDYFFVPHKPSAIAIAAVLNAMEGIDQSYLPQDAQQTFLFNAKYLVGIVSPAKEALQLLQQHLWNAYIQSSQSSYITATPQSSPKYSAEDHSMECDPASVSQSPVSVAYPPNK
uniref:Cyclin-like domain-containing protein n=1 Tax=Ditylum brightwellii TaxID=49249 RepID=A0A7S4RBU3_9STRA